MNHFTKKFFLCVCIWAIGSLTVLGSQHQRRHSYPNSKMDLYQWVKDLPTYLPKSHSKKTKSKKTSSKKIKAEVKKKEAKKILIKKEAKKLKKESKKKEKEAKKLHKEAKKIEKKAKKKEKKKLLIKKDIKKLEKKLEKKEKNQINKGKKKTEKRKQKKIKNFSPTPNQKIKFQNFVKNENVPADIRVLHEKIFNGSKEERKEGEKILEENGFKDWPNLVFLNTRYMRYLLNSEK